MGSPTSGQQGAVPASSSARRGGDD